MTPAQALEIVIAPMPPRAATKAISQVLRLWPQRDIDEWKALQTAKRAALSPPPALRPDRKIADFSLPLEVATIKEWLRQAGVSGVSGCYVVRCPQGECLYVGRSSDLLNRICGHIIDQRDGNGRQWRLGGASEWYFRRPFAQPGCTIEVHVEQHYKELERELILECRPAHNRCWLAMGRNGIATPNGACV